MAKPSYKALFEKYRDDTVINQHEQYAYWTLPYLMTDQREVNSYGRVVVERDFQEVGALLVNNLAAKLARLLFPMQYPFFRASASKEFKDWAAKKGLSDEALNAKFASIEMEAKNKLFLNAGYAQIILALKYIIVTGNALINRSERDRKMLVWGPNAFACKRDGTGMLLDTVLREFTCVEALPDELAAALRAGNKAKYSRPEQSVEKYTRIHRMSRNGQAGFQVSEEVDGVAVGEPSWYPEQLCPWMVPTWTLIPGEHMGRGLVEDYAGGFARLSSLSEAAALYGVEMMRVVHLVGPGSSDVDSLNKAESGEYVAGDPEQIKAYEAGDAKKAEQVAAEIERVFQRLARAFMYGAQTRQAERVTAYEIQREAQEAEHALGGAISTLSGSLQIPLAHVLTGEVSKEAKIGLVLGEIRPDVTAGLDAMGRSADTQNVLQAAQEIAAVAPVAQLDPRISMQKIVDIILAGRSIDPTSIFYSEEDQRKNAEATAAQNNAQLELVKAQTLAQSAEGLNAVQGV